MTHPIYTEPRGPREPGSAKPPMLELQPQGGCPGQRKVGRIHAYCMHTCARQCVGGPQIQPMLVVRDGLPSCVNHVPHGVNVLPLPAAEQAVQRGGSGNTSSQGAPR
jgi:hypothetical protein